jgi:hypothetical protein
MGRDQRTSQDPGHTYRQARRLLFFVLWFFLPYERRCPRFVGMSFICLIHPGSLFYGFPVLFFRFAKGICRFEAVEKSSAGSFQIRQICYFCS